MLLNNSNHHEKLIYKIAIGFDLWESIDARAVAVHVFGEDAKVRGKEVWLNHPKLGKTPSIKISAKGYYSFEDATSGDWYDLVTLYSTQDDRASDFWIKIDNPFCPIREESTRKNDLVIAKDLLKGLKFKEDKDLDKSE
jgi:hypothetical protein